MKYGLKAVRMTDDVINIALSSSVDDARWFNRVYGTVGGGQWSSSST